MSRDLQKLVKRRRDRIYKQRERGSRRSYVTESEDLSIMLAWEAGEITEGLAASAMGVDRLEARRRKNAALGLGIDLGYNCRFDGLVVTPTLKDACEVPE